DHPQQPTREQAPSWLPQVAVSHRTARGEADSSGRAEPTSGVWEPSVLAYAVTSMLSGMSWKSGLVHCMHSSPGQTWKRELSQESSRQTPKVNRALPAAMVTYCLPSTR